MARKKISATPIPDDFAPNQATIANLREIGIDAVSVTEYFKDLARMKGWVYADWQAAMRVLLAKEKRWDDERRRDREPTTGGVWRRTLSGRER